MGRDGPRIAAPRPPAHFAYRVHRLSHVMNSVSALTDLTPAQRRELLKMALARDLVRDRSELPPIEPAAREGRLPLSFAQERLWFIDRMEPGSAVYNIPVAWRLVGALDVAALER